MREDRDFRGNDKDEQKLNTTGYSGRYGNLYQ